MSKKHKQGDKKQGKAHSQTEFAQAIFTQV
jgi:hypothetical protein